MQLSEFIRHHRESILDEWKDLSGSHDPAANGHDGPCLRGHLADILLAVADDMDEMAANNEARGEWMRQPEERLAQVCNQNRAVLEYGALREAVSRRWASHLGADGWGNLDEFARFSKVVDASMAAVIAQFDRRLRQAGEEQAQLVSMLADSEQRFRAWVNASSHVVYRVSPDGREMRQLDGRGAVVDTKRPSQSWLDGYVYPEDQRMVVRAFREAMQSKSLFEIEHRYRRVDGRIGWTLSRAIPLLDEDGEIIEWFGAASDVTARRKAEEALREADRSKDEFLAVLGHELRNPLSPLRTGVDLLKEARRRPELLDTLRPMMDRQLSHLVRLVDDLLDISRISRGQITLQRAPLDLNAPVEAAIEQVKPAITARRHQLHLNLSRAPLPVEGDYVRLTQVVINLLSNAAKYMEPGGAIHVFSEVENGEAVIRVRDTGDGIPPDRIHRLFKLFSRLTEHGSRADSGGLGVGLALSHQLMTLHGGTIEAESSGPGQGSEFVVRLGLSCQKPRVAVSGAADDASASARRVLVVEDNVDAAETLRMLLRIKGHVVQVANDGPAALEQVVSFTPQVMLLDLGLPGMDGTEVARRVRSMPEGERVLLVAVTGWGQDEDRQRTAAAGFDGHVTKPIAMAEIDQLLASEPLGAERREWARP